MSVSILQISTFHWIYRNALRIKPYLCSTNKRKDMESNLMKLDIYPLETEETRFMHSFKTMRYAMLCLLSVFSCSVLSAQSLDAPRLVVGIVVDQMRQDYLYRFGNKFSEDGFKRLMREGYQYKNAHYHYVPTHTAPGHASIYTGTTPSYHGIIGNGWYSTEKGKRVYCVGDSDVMGVGGSKDTPGKVSPKNLLASTITDALQLASNFASRVVSVSIKDRSAVLSGGHAPTGVYWLDGKTGNFMTSTYYCEALPEWVIAFNQRKLANQYLNGSWSTLLPLDQYTESTADGVWYERGFGEGEASVFPYDLRALARSRGASAISTTPYGNTLVLDMALAAIEGEELGRDASTDFLSIGFSSTDYVGHAFGPYSIELEDTYLRLDAEIGRLLAYLDAQFPSDYLLFLTSDHGVAHVPGFLTSHKLTGGHASPLPEGELKGVLLSAFGEGEWIMQVYNDQVYLNRELLYERGIALKQAQAIVKGVLLKIPEVSEVYTADELARRDGAYRSKMLVENGYHSKLSGDVVVGWRAGYIQEVYGKKGTTHGSGYAYDTHVPMLFFGQGIPRGESVREVAIIDIAPSLSMLLNIGLPNSVTGHVLTELFE